MGGGGEERTGERAEGGRRADKGTKGGRGEGRKRTRSAVTQGRKETKGGQGEVRWYVYIYILQYIYIYMMTVGRQLSAAAADWDERPAWRGWGWMRK